MFIFNLFTFEHAAIKLRARNKFLQICYQQRCQITSEIQTFNNLSFFLSQNIPQYDRTALHIIKIKINFVATLRHRGLIFLWLVLLMVVEYGSIKHHPILSQLNWS